MTSESDPEATTTRQSEPWGRNVLVEIADEVAWVTLNRPDKRNAMSPALNDEMNATLDVLEGDDRCGVVVLTGAGDSWSAGMDLKEFFRATDGGRHVDRTRVYRSASQWQWHKLLNFYKPTIAMVNGWCFGGAMTPLVACDIAIAADEACFGVSEINWGIIPGGNVSRMLAKVMGERKALYYVMTGEQFDGREAAALGLVTESVPLDQLKARTAALAATLLGKNPTTLRQAKISYKLAADMTLDQAQDYLTAKNDQARLIDPEQGRAKAMQQFLDDKTFRPGMTGYTR